MVLQPVLVKHKLRYAMTKISFAFFLTRNWQGKGLRWRKVGRRNLYDICIVLHDLSRMTVAFVKPAFLKGTLERCRVASRFRSTCGAAAYQAMALSGAAGVVFSIQEMFVLGRDLFCGDDPWDGLRGLGSPNGAARFKNIGELFKNLANGALCDSCKSNSAKTRWPCVIR